MPTGVDHIQISGPPIPRMWCHSTIVKQTTAGVVGDIVLFDENGTVLVEVQGFRVQSLDKVKAPFSSAQQADAWLYEPRWRSMPRSPKEEIPEETAGRWLIFADSKYVAAQLTTQLEMHNQKCVLVTPGQALDDPKMATGAINWAPTQSELLTWRIISTCSTRLLQLTTFPVAAYCICGAWMRFLLERLPLTS